MKVELKTIDHTDWNTDKVTFEEYEDDAIEIKHNGDVFRIAKKDLMKVLHLFGEESE